MSSLDLDSSFVFDVGVPLISLTFFLIVEVDVFGSFVAVSLPLLNSTLYPFFFYIFI